MINSNRLLEQLQSKATSRNTIVKRLEDDLRRRCDELQEVDAPLRERYDQAKSKGRTALTYKAWREEELTQVAVAWVLGCVFVRFLEDNELVEVPKLSGPGDRLQRARDEHELYFRRQPEDNTERGYLIEVFEEVGKLPAMKEFFDKKHNPLWLALPSGDACRELWQFWQRTDPGTGAIHHDFTDPDWNTRFLGDLYQDLSETARKRYALLQTPDFVESFILDRTLTPAIETFGYRVVRMIDPTCGSGHFLLGAFARLFRIWLDEDPGENPRVLGQQALNGVYGVDLNPFAVAIARFRLLLAALKVCGVKQLKNAPDFQIHLAVGDSLIHGARFDREGKPYVIERQDMFGGKEDVFKDELAHFFDTEDSAKLHRILGQQYHAVVGNPPYITVKDKALNQLYRGRCDACSGKYALSVPFMERFFDLALAGSDDGRELAGFTGQITSNSFMKREFGKKLIEEHIPRWDLTHVLDTSGAYIPGHGTPTVILFGRNQRPQSTTVRMLEGIRGEPSTPANPSKGKVWLSVLGQIDSERSQTDFVVSSTPDTSVIHHHPWILSELARELNERYPAKLSKRITRGSIGAVTGEDEAFTLGDAFPRLLRVSISRRQLIEGDAIRDWQEPLGESIVFPYDTKANATFFPASAPFLWNYRSPLNARVWFRKPHRDRDLHWWEYAFISESIASAQMLISFAEVATHNHFVLDLGAKVFKQTAPVLKLPKDATEDDHLGILGLLNSAAACFWMKQVFHCKGSTVDQHGARQTTVPFEDFYQIDGTKLKQFPIPTGSTLLLARELDHLARELAAHSPDALAARDSVSADALTEAEQTAAGLCARMISLQEELDWQCYRHYGLTGTDDDLEWPEERLDALPPLTLGERSFEIRMARQMATGELETTWFERHKDAGSKLITELPIHWPDDYRAFVERRLACIEANKNINLIERPEYKRRWNTEPWAKRQQLALRNWLLARLEGYFFEGSRVCDLGANFEPAAHGFTAATRPHLVTGNQFADVVSSDIRFLEAAEVYEGTRGFSVPKLIRALVESESVPYLPLQRYKESGLRKRSEWESTWELQRKEDAVETRVLAENDGVDSERLKKLIQTALKQEVGDIPVPPKYGRTDFIKSSCWSLRGKLDVPKERWISYPGAERVGDDSMLIAWAGWDHLQQAQALAEYFIDAKDNQGWQADRLKPLLAGLADLIPWLKQWHNDHNPEYGMGLGDYFVGFLEEQCRSLDLTVENVNRARFEATTNN